ncbi:MAG: branched-chain amino acid transaminase [Anaerolineae bacterium]
MPIPKSEKIWFNGQFVPWDEAQVHVTAHALHYGSSVFEGIRCYSTTQGPAIFRLDAHVDRLYKSAKIYRTEIPYSPDELRQAIIDTVRVNKHQSCYIRPLVFRGAGGLGLKPRQCPIEVVIITFEWGRYLGPEALEEGVDVCVSSWARMAPNTYPALAKAGGHYTNSQLVAMEALENGYTEGIALDVSGYVSEGAGENVFLVEKDTIRTPPLASSILGGITRGCVMTLGRDLGYEVREELIPREALYIADEVFFTGTAAEITPTRSIDRIPIGTGHRGLVTERIQSEFLGITSGQVADRYGWLTLV